MAIRNVTVIVLLVSLTWVDAKGPTPAESGFMQSTVDKLVKTLLDSFFDRGFQASALDNADMKETTLGQPGHFAIASRSNLRPVGAIGTQARSPALKAAQAEPIWNRGSVIKSKAVNLVRSKAAYASLRHGPVILGAHAELPVSIRGTVTKTKARNLAKSKAAYAKLAEEKATEKPEAAKIGVPPASIRGTVIKNKAKNLAKSKAAYAKLAAATDTQVESPKVEAQVPPAAKQVPEEKTRKRDKLKSWAKETVKSVLGGTSSDPSDDKKAPEANSAGEKVQATVSDEKEPAAKPVEKKVQATVSDKMEPAAKVSGQVRRLNNADGTVTFTFDS